MADAGSPMNRSIGLAGLLRWLIVLAGTVAAGAAIADRRYGLALALFVFVLVAVVLGIRAGRARDINQGGS
jgi:hypothetical protein